MAIFLQPIGLYIYIQSFFSSPKIIIQFIITRIAGFQLSVIKIQVILHENHSDYYMTGVEVLCEEVQLLS
jgi:hypothetical protein